jgi:hypothetical protein
MDVITTGGARFFQEERMFENMHEPPTPIPFLIFDWLFHLASTSYCTAFAENL